MEAITAESLLKQVKVDPGRWDRMPSEGELSGAVAAIEARGVRVAVASGRSEALAKLAELIPAGAEVMNGSSTTLIEIGFMDALERGERGWRSVRKGIDAENDQAKRMELRRKSVCSDYFVAGVNAIASTGELVACDAGGSRVGAFPFAAKNLVLVCGANKLVPTLADALARVKEFSYPLEDARMRKLYNTGSMLGKYVIMAGERPGRISLVLVKERLGY